MRRTLLLTLLAVVAVPMTALAGQEAPGDGSLSVRNGEGFVGFSNFRGALIGKAGSGTLVEVEVTLAEECETVSVFGEERIVKREKLDELGAPKMVCIFTSNKGVLRWRLVTAQPQNVRFKKSRELGFSAVGKGTVSIKGTGGNDDGQLSFNGEQYDSLPDELARFTLAAPVPNG